MPLIKCPECKRKISDTAKSCPRCGFILDNKVSMLNNQDSNVSANRFSDILLYIIKLEWLDDVSDFLYDIPIIGGVLSAIFTFICLILTIPITLGLIISFFWVLSLIHPYLAIAVGAIGLNVIAYCASYVWNYRKGWFFWTCIVLTVLAFIMVLTQ